jgi:hypothetical protein
MESYVAKESQSDYPMDTHGLWPGKTYIYRESDGQHNPLAMIIT